MIITNSPFLGTFEDKEIKPNFFFHSTCNNCCKVIYKAAFRDKRVDQFWFHDETESEFCHSQYINLRADYNVDNTKCEPVFGPVNLELYWS